MYSPTTTDRASAQLLLPWRCDLSIRSRYSSMISTSNVICLLLLLLLLRATTTKTTKICFDDSMTCHSYCSDATRMTTISCCLSNKFVSILLIYSTSLKDVFNASMRIIVIELKKGLLLPFEGSTWGNDGDDDIDDCCCSFNALRRKPNCLA